ncbi:MAG: hypothetical protein KC422_02780 [Trueperaceae bacterium]|nr:hypothetical protein [Trueperaceae bacterium]
MILLIGLAILVVGFVLIVQGVQSKQGSLRSLGGVAVVVGALVALLSSAFVIVPAGNTGVVFNVFGGVQDRERGEGFHIILPFLQEVTVFNTREQALDFTQERGDEIQALSEEGLAIDIDATIRFRINGSNASSIYQDLGLDGSIVGFENRADSYQATLIRPQVRSVIRNAVANYKAAELISTQRTAMQREIFVNLQESLSRGNVDLIEVLLRDIRIPESVRQVIEEKQTAEQRVEVEENLKRQAEIAAQRRVTEAQGERDAEIARAEGEAQALTLRGQAIRENPEIIQLEIAQKLAPSVQTILLPSEGNFLLDVRGLMNGTQPALPPGQ